jgi:hypothetical protein
MSKIILAAAAMVLSACGMWGGSLPEQPTPIPTFAAGNPVIQGGLLGGKPSNDLLVWVFSEPEAPSRGPNTLRLLVTDPQGQPVTGATVSLDIDMTNMSHGKNVTIASEEEPGRYSGAVFFLMPGPWRLIVDIEQAGKVDTVRFDFMVNW